MLFIFYSFVLSFLIRFDHALCWIWGFDGLLGLICYHLDVLVQWQRGSDGMWSDYMLLLLLYHSWHVSRVQVSHPVWRQGVLLRLCMQVVLLLTGSTAANIEGVLESR